MTPPKVFSLKGQLYLEEGAEITELIPLDDAAHKHRTLGWIQFLLGALLGVVVAWVRFVLL